MMLVRLGQIVCLFFLFISGCTGITRDVAWQEPGTDLVWPEGSEKPRIRFLRLLTAETTRHNTSEGKFFRWIVGEEAVEPLRAPYGVAADGKGRVWVADSGAQKVYAFDLGRSRVTSLNTENGGGFSFPVGVAVDPERERVFVSDSGLAKVLEFTTQGRFLNSVVPPDGFLRPAGATVDSKGNLYVTDALRGTVEVFSPQGDYLRRLGSARNPDGKFNRPANVAVDGSGRIHVVDSLNFRVEVLDSDGAFSALVGGVGDTAGRFARPRGIAVDSAGHVYVADAAFDNIQIFDSAGRLLLVLGRAGKERGMFCMPAGMAFDSQDRLYVADSCNNRVQVFQYIP